MIKLFQRFVMLLLLSNQLLNADLMKNSIATIELGLMGYEYWHALKQQKNNNPLSLPPLKKISIEPPIESPKYKPNSYPYLWYGLGSAAALAGASWLLYSWLHSKANIKSLLSNTAKTNSFEETIIENKLSTAPQRFTQPIGNLNVSQQNEHKLDSQSAEIVHQELAKIPQQNDLSNTTQPNTKDETRAYQILGLSHTNQTPAAINHAFRISAQKTHPDHGGDINDFQNLVLARDLLLGTKTSEQETTKIPASENSLAITYPTQVAKPEPTTHSIAHPLESVEHNNFQEEIVENMLIQNAIQPLAQTVDVVKPTPMIPLPKKLQRQRSKQYNTLKKLTSSIIGSPIPADSTTLKSLHSINDLAKKLTKKKIARDSFKQNKIPDHQKNEVLNSELRLIISKINLLNEEWNSIEKTINRTPPLEKSKLKESIQTLIEKISEITQPTHEHFTALREMLQEKTISSDNSSDKKLNNTQSNATKKQLTIDMIQKAVAELKNKIN